jgi:hypothetical protein
VRSTSYAPPGLHSLWNLSWSFSFEGGKDHRKDREARISKEGGKVGNYAAFLVGLQEVVF